MIVHQVFAQIFEEKVKNIIVCDSPSMADYLAKATYGETAFAVDCTYMECAIGCRYSNGRFYKLMEDGSESLLKIIPTEKESIVALTDENNRYSDYIIDMDYRLSLLET